MSKYDDEKVSATQRYNDLFSKSSGFLLETRRNWISTSTQILGWSGNGIGSRDIARKP